MMPNEQSTVLVIAAHPDDEVLGCGGTMSRFAQDEVTVYVAYLADGVGARDDQTKPNATELAQRRRAAESACAILGARPPSFDDLPDNQLDTVPLLEIARKVEALIDRHKPDTVFTHHPGDVNIDHQRVHQAVVTACRPEPGHPVRRLMFFEVASSTEWQPPGSGPGFAPNVFIDISGTLDKKLEALQLFEAELRPWPHARSLEAVQHHASWRGATAGMEAAEAFVLGRELL